MKKNLNNFILKFFSVVLTLLYPFIVLFVLKRGVSLRFIALLIGIMCVANFLRNRVTSFAFLICGVVFSGFLYFMNNVLFFKFYPVMMNFLFASAFTFSILGKGEPIIAKFARQMGYDLTEQGAKSYVRKATIAWSIFLCANTIVSLITVFMSDVVWVMYNGFVSYILMACMMFGEYFVRRRVIGNVR